MRHHVEAATVRHANKNMAGTRFGRFADHLIEDRHEHVGALDGEPRLAGKRAMQESLESLHLRQALEKGDGVDRIVRRPELARFDGVPQPSALFGDEHVRVVVADARAVQAAQRLEDLCHVRRAGSQR